MDPKYFGNQHIEDWIVCQHCHQLFPTPEALAYHVYCVARLQSNIHHQQYPYTSLKNFVPPNQGNNSQEALQTDQCFQRYHQLYNNIKYKINSTSNSYLQAPYYPQDHAPSKDITFEQNQTITFEDPKDLHKFLACNQYEGRKGFQAHIRPGSDQNIDNGASTAENTTKIPPQPLITEKMSSPGSECTEESENEIRYMCTLCGADFNNIRDANKHKSNHPKLRYSRIIFQYQTRKHKVKEEKNNDIEDDDVKFVPLDNEATIMLPSIVSTLGSQGLEQNVRPNLNLLNLNSESDDTLLEKHQSYASENRQDEVIQAKIKISRDFGLNVNKENSFTEKKDEINHVNILENNIINNCESHKVNETIITAEHKNQSKRKEERKYSNVVKKRCKLRPADEYKKSKKLTVKACLRKPKNKKNKGKDSASLDEENSQLDSSGTESDDFGQEIQICLKKIIPNKEIFKMKDLLKSLFCKKDKSKRKPKVKIYKCKECSICFTKESKLRKHIQRGDHNVKKKRCVICRLKFSKKYIEKHIQKHHFKMKLQVKDFNMITELRSESSSLSSNSDDEINTNHNFNLQNPEPATSKQTQSLHFRKSIISKPFHENYTTVQSSVDNYQNQATSKLLPITPNEEPKKDNLHNIKVYKCGICNICFVHRKTWWHHMIYSDHNPKTKMHCEKCDLSFTKLSYNKHIILHHNKDVDSINLKISTKDSNKNNEFMEESPRFIHKLERKTKETDDVSNVGLTTTTVQTSVDNYHNQVTTNLLPDTPNEQPKNDISHINKVYKCEICDMCFVHYKTWSDHMIYSDHNPKTKTKCEKCDLNFTKLSYNKHINLHHYNNFDVINLKIVTIDSIKNNEFTEESPRFIHKLEYKTKETSKSICNGKVTTQLKKSKTVEQKPKILNSKTYSNSIYKCRKCKICFLTRGAIKTHFYRRKHDITAAKTCSICGFSFLFINRHFEIQHKILKLRDKTDFQVITLPNCKLERKRADGVCHSPIQPQSGLAKKVNDVIVEDMEGEKTYMELKECVVKLIDLKSTLVSPTSNDDITSEEEDFINDTETTEFRKHTENNSSQEQEDDYINIENTVNVHNLTKNTSDTVLKEHIKMEKLQDSLEVLNKNVLNSEENTFDVGNATASRINTKTSDERDSTEKKQEKILTEQKIVTSNGMLIYLQKNAEDIIKRGFELMKFSKADLDAKTNCDPASIFTNDSTIKLDYADKACTEEKEEVTRDLVSDPNADEVKNFVTEYDAAKLGTSNLKRIVEENDAKDISLHEKKKLDSSRLSKNMSKSTENLFNILSGNADE